jgi:hypothetical protein
MPPLLPRFPPDARLFFLYGGDLGRLSAARRELLARLVPPEERDSLLVEIEPPASRLLSLDQIAPQIMEELGTPAFFPGQQRVVVVTGIQDIIGGSGASRTRKKPAKKPTKAKKGAAATDTSDAPPPSTPSERMVAYLNGEFREEANVLVVIAEEDEDKMRKVRDDDPLVAHLLGRAVTIMYREPPIRFEFEQAIYDRDAIRAVRLFREWFSPDTRAAVFAALSHTVRIMLQLRVRDSKPELRGVGGGGRAASGAEALLLENYFPKGRGSLSTTHPFVLKKAEQGARRYSTAELVAAHSRLLDLNDAFYPPRGADFVADLPIAVEHFILRLCG